MLVAISHVSCRSALVRVFVLLLFATLGFGGVCPLSLSYAAGRLRTTDSSGGDVAPRQKADEAAREERAAGRTAQGEQIHAALIATEEVRARAHMQGVGWMPTVGNGQSAGMAGKGKRMEALRVNLAGVRVAGGVQASAHVQGIGWQGFCDGYCGTTGQSRRVEAIRMRLTGEAASVYDLYYRVCVQGVGWLSWATADEVAGSSGMSLRVEAVQTRLVAKGAAAPSNADAVYPQAELSPLSVHYETCQQGVGWLGEVANGKVSGNLMSTKPLAGLRASIKGGIVLGGIQYRAHMQGTGWMGWQPNGADLGRPSLGKRMEAIQIRLTGIAARMYRVWYRVNVQGLGWLGWASDGQSAGTEGMSRRMLAIQVQLVSKVRPAPGSTDGAFKKASVRWGLKQAVNTRSVSAFGGYAPSARVRDALRKAIDGVRGRGYDVGFIMMDLASYKGVAYNCDALFYGASSIKAPYIASVVHQHPDAIRLYKEDIQQTLFYSYDHNYKQVYSGYGKDPMRVWCKESGARASIAEDLPWVNYSARDLAFMWGRTYTLYGTSAEAEILGTWCERPNVSTIHATLGRKYRTRSKGGWIEDGGARYDWLNGGGPEWDVTDDGGIVYARNGTYVMAIMSSIPADHDALNSLTAAIDAAHSEM